MNRSETLPKLLPWLAKHAGIDQDRAVALWSSAQALASKQESATDTPDYWHLSMDHFKALLEQESTRMDHASFGLRPYVRNQAKWLHAVAEAYNRTSCQLLNWYMLPARIMRHIKA